MRDGDTATRDNAAEAEADSVRRQVLRSTRVELEPIRLTEHRQRYRVTYAVTLVEGRRNPIFDACRALLAQDITGRLEVWRGTTSADMQLDIERGVIFAIRETTTLSLRLVPRHPWMAHRRSRPEWRSLWWRTAARAHLRFPQWWILANENGRQ
jgi:hypothetical protein